MFEAIIEELENSQEVNEMIEKVDAFELEELSNLWAEVIKNQPFLHRFLFSYESDMSLEMLIEFQRIVAMIYLHFKDFPKFKTLKIWDNDYEMEEKRNADFIHYFSGEDDAGQVNTALSDLMKLKSKGLYFGIVTKFESYPLLSTIDPFDKTIMLLEIKSLIECFERRLM